MEGEKENPQCYKEVGRARSYEEQTNSSSSKLMFSGTEFNFQQNLLSALQACLKGKLRHLHFMRYSSHIQNMLTAQRLHYHDLALSARTASYCRFCRCSHYCSTRKLKELLSYLWYLWCYAGRHIKCFRSHSGCRAFGRELKQLTQQQRSALLHFRKRSAQASKDWG